MAHNYGLLEANNGLFWGIVAYFFRLLGCPGRAYWGLSGLIGSLPLLRLGPFGV